MDGYSKFQVMGRHLKGKGDRPPVSYSSMDTNTLRIKRQEAETWLEENTDHPLYPQALSRYEKIMQELEER